MPHDENNERRSLANELHALAEQHPTLNFIDRANPAHMAIYSPKVKGTKKGNSRNPVPIGEDHCAIRFQAYRRHHQRITLPALANANGDTLRDEVDDLAQFTTLVAVGSTPQRLALALAAR
jgi:hypothetical protein